MRLSLKIAMLAPIKRPLTPDTTVSRPRVIVDLASELIKRGHKITILGTADSSLPGAEIVGIVPKGLNFLPVAENPFYQHTAYLTQMIKYLIDHNREFDLIHNHMYPEYLPLLGIKSLNTPMLTTVHSQMVPETVATLKVFPEAHLVAISDMSKRTAGIDSMTVIRNSVDTDLFVPDETNPKTYLLCVGRMSAAKDAKGSFLDPKGIQNAILIAQKTGEHLKIVGNVEDPVFFETLVKPHLSAKIEFLGKVSAEQTLTRYKMVKLFQGAKAFINAINWEEPFGLVMAEALSTGTPVIAYNRGAVAEIVKDGVTGFIVEPSGPAARQPQNQPAKGHPAFGAPRLASPDDEKIPWEIKKRGIEGFVEATKRINEIDRNVCREHAVNHFSKKRMVDEYEKLYFTMTSSFKINSI